MYLTKIRNEFEFSDQFYLHTLIVKLFSLVQTFTSIYIYRWVKYLKYFKILKMATSLNYKFKPLPASNSNNINTQPDHQVYRDIEIPDFSIGDHVVWTELLRKHPSSSSSSTFGIGIVHRIVHYVNPTSHAEHLLAFVYFYEWVPDSVEVTWPDGERYYRHLLPVSNLRQLPLNKAHGNKDQLKDAGVDQVVLRPCNLSNVKKSTHPMIQENATIFNIHKKRGVKGVVMGFSKDENGNSYIEADFELEIYPGEELEHSSNCSDPENNGCNHRLAINLRNLSQHFWDSEFKLVINNERVKFEDLFIKPEPSSPNVVDAKPSIVIFPTPPKPKIRVQTRSMNISANYPTPNKEPTQLPPSRKKSAEMLLPSVNTSQNNKPTSTPLDKNQKSEKKSVSNLMRELGSKFTLRKKKPSPKNGISIPKTTPPIPQNYSLYPNPNPSTPIKHNSLPRNTHYVGEYYNDFDQTTGAENPPPQNKHSSKFNTLPNSEPKPRALKPSFRSNKSYPAPPPPLPSSAPPSLSIPDLANIPAKISNSELPTKNATSTLPSPPFSAPSRATPNIANIPAKILHKPELPTKNDTLPPPPPPPLAPTFVQQSSSTNNGIQQQLPSRSNLLQEIRSGKSLRHVVKSDDSSKNKPLQLQPTSGTTDFASIMMGALANRRAMIDNDSDSGEENDADCRKDSATQDKKDTDHDNEWD